MRTTTKRTPTPARATLPTSSNSPTSAPPSPPTSASSESPPPPTSPAATPTPCTTTSAESPAHAPRPLRPRHVHRRHPLHVRRPRQALVEVHRRTQTAPPPARPTNPGYEISIPISSSAARRRVESGDVKRVRNMMLWSWVALILILMRQVVVRLYRHGPRPRPTPPHRPTALRIPIPTRWPRPPPTRSRRPVRRAPLPVPRAEGFDEITFSFTQSLPFPDATGVHAFLVNRRDGQMASLIASNSTVTSTRDLVVSVGCLFEDDSSFCTGTRTAARAFPDDPTDDRVTAHWIRDAHVLCEFHRRRLAASPKADLPRVVPPPGGEPAFLANEWAAHARPPARRPHRPPRPRRPRPAPLHLEGRVPRHLPPHRPGPP